jgi:hypothetical protein
MNDNELPQIQGPNLFPPPSYRFNIIASVPVYHHSTDALVGSRSFLKAWTNDYAVVLAWFRRMEILGNLDDDIGYRVVDNDPTVQVHPRADGPW